MVNYLITCRSLTFAQRTAKRLAQGRITAIVTRTPIAISSEGCGYCVKVPERHIEDALTVLKRTELYPKRLFKLYENGELFEVAI